MRSSYFLIYKDAVSAPSDVSITFSDDAKTINIVSNGVFNQFQWDDLASHAEAGDYDRWVLTYVPNAPSAMAIPPLFNAHAVTASVKRDFKDAMHLMPLGTKWLHIFIRPGDANFSEAFYIVNLHPEAQVVLDSRLEARERQREFTTGRKAYHFDMSITGPSTVNEEGAVYNVNVDRPANCYIYLKSDSGFVPRKVRLTDGQGSFTFNPMGTFPGDVIEIKAGFRHWSNYASITVTRT